MRLHSRQRSRKSESRFRILNSRSCWKRYSRKAAVGGENTDSKYYGDYNGDKKTEGIKAELTNENGTGFKGISQFSGSFNGNGYSIKNLYSKYNCSKSMYYNGFYIGFFHKLDGDIKNLKLEDVNIYANIVNAYCYIGAIAGDCGNKKIENCYVSGKDSENMPL